MIQIARTATVEVCEKKPTVQTTLIQRSATALQNMTPEQIATLHELQRILEITRSERAGLPLWNIAECLGDFFTKEEIKQLVKILVEEKL